MLTKLKLKNYCTFVNETIIDLQATNSKILQDDNVHNKVLKGVLFVGENASGKSNILKAIKLLLDMLFYDNYDDFGINVSLYNPTKPTMVEYTFEILDKEIRYLIEFNSKSILREKMFIGDDEVIDRIKDSGSTYFTEQPITNNIDSKDLLFKKDYYATKCNDNKYIKKLIEFLSNSIYINCSLRKIQYTKTNIDIDFEKYLQNHDETVFNNFFKTINYNSRIKYYKNNNSLSLERTIGFDLKFIKNGTTLEMPFISESDGNKSLMNLILPFIYVTSNNGMLIVDEFSSGLHNELEEAFIKYFFANARNSQLIFASHSTNLLSTFYLRPDQIYSVSFNSKDFSSTKRFSKENPRESQNLEKMYLNGVFDGMPTYTKKYKN